VDTPSGRKKHALITGASSGIGKEIAKALAAEAYQPILVGRHRDTLEQAAHEILGERGADAIICPADLSEADAPQAIFDHLQERDIAVDLLVNNAGLVFEGEFAAIALRDHLQLLHVNVVALTAMTRLFIEPMLRRADGRILNVASVAAFAPVPTVAAYAASKAYVLSLTESMAEELKGTGVTVTALCPGFTDTPMMHRSPRTEHLPAAIVMDAESVAKQGVAACLAGDTVCVAGIYNSLLARGVHLVPREVTRTVAGYMARQLR